MTQLNHFQQGNSVLKNEVLKVNANMGILTLILTPMPVLELALRSKEKRQFRECNQGNFVLVTFLLVYTVSCPVKWV